MHASTTPIKDSNAIKILTCVRDHLQLSRADISRHTGLSKPTVTRIVDRLLADAYLMETGEFATPGAKRKPIGIKLYPDAFYCVGVNVSRHGISAVITDFPGELKAIKNISLPQVLSAEEFVDLISSIMWEILREADISEDCVFGAGIGIPGLVDNNTGMIINYASENHWMNIPIKSILETRFSFPVFVDNDANTLILSEQLFNTKEDMSNSIFVNCWDGVGSAVIINGNLLRGHSNSVGEIGHMVVEPRGRQCTCGKHGCVEACYSSSLLCESIVEALNRGRTSIIRSSAANKQINCQDIMRCYEQGDSLCHEHVQQLARYLSICLSNTINILNPKTMILSGELFEYSNAFFELVRDSTCEMLISPANHPITFTKRSKTDKIYTRGAVSLVYDTFYTAS